MPKRSLASISPSASSSSSSDNDDIGDIDHPTPKRQRLAIDSTDLPSTSSSTTSTSPLLDTSSDRSIESAVRHSFELAGFHARQHQVQAVTRLITDLSLPPAAPNDASEHADAAADLHGAAMSIVSPRNYLIQHSAGSGKSLTIACLLLMLARLTEPSSSSSSSSDSSLAPHWRFQHVLVMNDRKALDAQLFATAKRFLDANASSSSSFIKQQQHHGYELTQVTSAKQLHRLLSKRRSSRAPPQIIFTTVQKLTRILDRTKPSSSSASKTASSSSSSSSSAAAAALQRTRAMSSLRSSTSSLEFDSASDESDSNSDSDAPDTAASASASSSSSSSSTLWSSSSGSRSNLGVSCPADLATLDHAALERSPTSLDRKHNEWYRSHQRIAIIADEAHRSHGRSRTRKLHGM